MRCPSRQKKQPWSIQHLKEALKHLSHLKSKISKISSLGFQMPFQTFEPIVVGCDAYQNDMIQGLKGVLNLFSLQKWIFSQCLTVKEYKFQKKIMSLNKEMFTPFPIQLQNVWKENPSFGEPKPFTSFKNSKIISQFEKFLIMITNFQEP